MSTKTLPHFGIGDVPPEGDWRSYRKTAIAQMLRIDEPFTVTNKEGKHEGEAGDMLVPDGYGGYYICGGEFHEKNYEEVRG